MGREDATSDRPASPARRGKSSSRQPLSARRPLSRVQSLRTPEYLVIGHICADLHSGGRVVHGGTALYSALTAARLGWRTAVMTRGVYGREVHGHLVPSLEEYADELSIVVQDADSTTMFINEYSGGRRTQHLPHWAGPIDLRGLPPHWRNAKIIHLGPIAQEIDPKQTGALTPEFLGATPQGWLRSWPKQGGRVSQHHLRLPPELVSRLDSIIVSQEEIALCRDTVEAVGAKRLGVITMGQDGSKIIYGGRRANIPAFDIDVADHTGAGDTFAAAFFVKATDRTLSAVKAARFASAVSGMSLREIGMNSTPTRDEVEEFMKTAEQLPMRR
jgi:sugar/nucleoside kinase (ribokinase family)